MSTNNPLDDLPPDLPYWKPEEPSEFENPAFQALCIELIDLQKDVTQWTEYCFDAGRALPVFQDEVLDMVAPLGGPDMIFEALDAYSETGDESKLEESLGAVAAKALSAIGERDADRACKVGFFRAALYGWIAWMDLTNDDFARALECFGNGREWFGHAVGLATAIWSDESVSTVARKAVAKRFAANDAAKTWVRSEWKAHSAAYEGNKSAFARDYVRRVRNERGVSITEKTMCEVWLRDTPDARIPAG